MWGFVGKKLPTNNGCRVAQQRTIRISQRHRTRSYAVHHALPVPACGIYCFSPILVGKWGTPFLPKPAEHTLLSRFLIGSILLTPWSHEVIFIKANFLRHARLPRYDLQNGERRSDEFVTFLPISLIFSLSGRATSLVAEANIWELTQCALQLRQPEFQIHTLCYGFPDTMVLWQCL